MDEKINTQACNYNYKNDIGLAMLGQVHSRLQLDTCRQSITKNDQVNNQYRFSRSECIKFCGTQELTLKFSRFCGLSAIKEHLACSNYVLRTIQNIWDAILKYTVQLLRRKQRKTEYLQVDRTHHTSSVTERRLILWYQTEEQIYEQIFRTEVQKVHVYWKNCQKLVRTQSHINRPVTHMMMCQWCLK
jgi:hypothetical protein